MKKWILNICLAVGVVFITSAITHLLGVKDWGGCFSAGAGAGIGMLISTRWRFKGGRIVRQA